MLLPNMFRSSIKAIYTRAKTTLLVVFEHFEAERLWLNGFNADPGRHRKVGEKRRNNSDNVEARDSKMVNSYDHNTRHINDY